LDIEQIASDPLVRGEKMKKAFTIVCGGILVMALVFAVAGQARAQAVWKEGKVTERQSSGGIHHIQLDGKKVYMLMKDCRIDMRIADRPGAYIEKKVDFGYISKGQRVSIKAEDNRCYQVLILQ
jgi:hypothetical protein